MIYLCRPSPPPEVREPDRRHSSEDGYIETNNHVIKDAKEITVVTANNGHTMLCL